MPAREVLGLVLLSGLVSDFLNYLSVGFMYVIFLSFFDVLLIDYFVVTSLFLSVELAVRLARVRANARYRGGHAVDQVSAVTGNAPAKE